MKSIVKLAAIAVAGCLFAGAANAETYAFMMGINDYPDVLDEAGKLAKGDDGKPIDPDLKGCVNDVTEMKDILLKKFMVRPENVRIALNKEGGEEGFVQGMKWLLSKPKEGDQIIFFYSGHGGQIKSKTEEDGIDEVIVLADNKLVQDDLFADVVQVTSKAGINATFIFDSCYSGGMSRDPHRKIKAMNTALERSPSKFQHLMNFQTAGIKAAFKKPQEPTTLKGSWAYLFAGSEEKPTIDISGIKDIPDHGVFTLFLTAALTDDPKSTMEDLVKTTKEVLKDLEFDQDPQGEFSSPERAKLPLIFG